MSTTLLGAALDLATKAWAFRTLSPGEVRPVFEGWLNFALSENTGAAFGIMAGRMGFFVAVSFGAALFLGYLLWRAPRDAGWGYGAVLGSIGAGVVGNLYDRLRFGRVRDFIDVYVSWEPLSGHLERWFGTAHWPTFNVADVLICAGAFGLFFHLWNEEAPTPREGTP